MRKSFPLLINLNPLFKFSIVPRFLPPPNKITITLPLENQTSSKRRKSLSNASSLSSTLQKRRKGGKKRKEIENTFSIFFSARIDRGRNVTFQIIPSLEVSLEGDDQSGRNDPSIRGNNAFGWSPFEWRAGRVRSWSAGVDISTFGRVNVT